MPSSSAREISCWIKDPGAGNDNPVMKQPALILLLSSLSPLLSAGPPSDRIYQAPMENAEWRPSNTGVLQCRLTHEIPLFGQAVFYRDSGRPLRLRIDAWQSYPKGMAVRFSSISAAWKGHQTETELGRLKTLGGGSPMLRTDAASARRAWYELQQGFQPTFRFTDTGDGGNSVAIVLSTVRFRDSLKSFNDCVARLYPDNFEDVKQGLVFFGFDEEFPPEGEEERALSRLLAYIRVDPSVKTVRVIGHADEKGSSCYNDNLSRRRAQYVYDWLLLSGLDPKMLQMEYRGEREPRVRGRSEKARAANRRVEVLLER